MNTSPHTLNTFQSWPKTTAYGSVLMVGLGAWLHTSVDNREIMLAAHAHIHVKPWLWDLITHGGDAGLLLGILLFVLRGQPSGLSLVLKSWLLGSVASQLLKRWWNIPRPAAVIDVSFIELIGSPPAFGHSMPSGHALAAGSALTILLMTVSRMNDGLKLILLAWSLLTAWSRVAVGAHWPADVLVGWGLGCWVVGVASKWESHRPWGTWVGSLQGHLLLAALYLSLLVYLLCWPMDTEVARGVSLTGAALAVYCTALQVQAIWRLRVW